VKKTAILLVSAFALTLSAQNTPGTPGTPGGPGTPGPTNPTPAPTDPTNPTTTTPTTADPNAQDGTTNRRPGKNTPDSTPAPTTPNSPTTPRRPSNSSARDSETPGAPGDFAALNEALTAWGPATRSAVAVLPFAEPASVEPPAEKWRRQ